MPEERAILQSAQKVPSPWLNIWVLQCINLKPNQGGTCPEVMACEVERTHSLATISTVCAELSALSQGAWLLVPKEASSCFLADSMRELWLEDFRLPLLGLFSCICRSVLAAALHCKEKR